jgi:hypothetical protein
MDWGGWINHQAASNDLDRVLSMNRDLGTISGETTLAKFLRSDESASPTWSSIVEAFKMTERELRNAHQWQFVRPDIFERLHRAYKESWSPAFSTNLVSASLRQRSFAAKMASDWCLGLDSLSNLEKAMARYLQFMFVDIGIDAENSIVPTLDIDLIWHTHQLFPVEYRSWCFDNLDKYVNHDDTVDESDLVVGLNQTINIWLGKYGEKYEVDYFHVTNPGPIGPPITNYCEYGPSCWPGNSSSENACVSLSENPCGEHSKPNGSKPSEEKNQLLSCRYRCGKCQKPSCHKPSKLGYNKIEARSDEVYCTPPVTLRLVSL